LRARLIAEPTLVGRKREIERLMQYFELILNKKGVTVFVCGEAGVGKTRLVNEFLEIVKKKGATILVGQCLSRVNIPYFPFREALSTHISTLRDEKVKSIVKKHLRTTEWLKDSEATGELRKRELFSTPKIDKDRTFQAVAEFFLYLSKQEPIILFMDDLHLADQLSLSLLHYLSRKCRNSRLLIIGTSLLFMVIVLFPTF